ncbi:amidase [Aestuariivirga sp.]|uniref:amidase n=1 Tax=Aestuariivirga sp. TaxID=2650926 RepID=UPI0039E65FA7
MKIPTVEDLRRLASSSGLALKDAELRDLAALCEGLAPAYDRIEQLAAPRLPVKYPRERGEAPDPSRNPHNAWAWRCEITGASKGPLSGIRVGIKDNICVAGMPMRNGSDLLAGFEPDEDATVVTRILDAGGIIAGKTTCEDLCFSGGSHTSRPQPVRNPHDPARSAGGSSSGNAAAIAAGDLTMCVGGDQGGSVRTPASWCGVVGLKPTHGLVPYTGAFPIEPTLDHLGPMGKTVADVALLLSVIAGPDGLDPRQRQSGIPVDYLAALNLPLKGMRIGVVQEGFGRPESDPATDHVVRAALKFMERAGAEVAEVSIPWHRDGYDIAAAVVLEGSARFLFGQNLVGFGQNGHHPEAMAAAWASAWRAEPDKLPDIGKFALLFEAFLSAHRPGTYYGKAQNLRRPLRAAYDEALSRFDVLAMPTTPFPATLLPLENAGFAERVSRGLDMEGNTAPFDASGHPAISVPCGLVGGLPVGLMLVARHHDEQNLLRAAAGFEMLGDWKSNSVART